MRMIIYGDFNCPYSYLASQRIDTLARLGHQVRWRAVEHDPRLPMTLYPRADQVLTSAATQHLQAFLQTGQLPRDWLPRPAPDRAAGSPPKSADGRGPRRLARRPPVP